MGPQRAELLKKELGIFTFRQLLEHYPYKYLDKTKISLIRDIDEFTDYVQVSGKLTSLEVIGSRAGRRLVGELKDSSGVLELVWFQGISWIEKKLQVGVQYQVFGRAGFFQEMPQITHPEIEILTPESKDGKNFLEPVYSCTEKLKARGLGGRQISKLTQVLLGMLREKDYPENIPSAILKKLSLISRYQAIQDIHFPESQEANEKAVRRLKFEELFIAQVRLGLIRSQRHRFSKGVVFKQVGEFFNRFYSENLPFELTGAQKRVLKEIRKDCGSGRQMNRLLQGDVGSGKTIVALLAMLLAADNGFQSCLMAPTEILARQHFTSISRLLNGLPLSIRLLTGSTKTVERKRILEELQEGTIHFIVGTHALIENPVQFQNLGLAIVDEQHRFGVAQRARLWEKADIHPHMLVMTATPIPRTLAMTAYGDLDTSIMNELPPGRKPIITVHRTEALRPKVMDFIKTEISAGRQIYVIFPLIEESQKLDYENLMKGYENVKAYFPEPRYYISMVHGKQTSQVRETNMQRFIKGDTQIMVATTVIEVGVDVPNASVMVIESAERFGLSQLHQLRGRVGRGSERSYCILITGNKLNSEAKERMQTMSSTSDGFLIAEKDLTLRGPGDIEGTRQSGMMNFKIADIVQDKGLLELARDAAENVIENDPEFTSSDNQSLKKYLQTQQGKTVWRKIS